ncbi:MAG: PIN domain-containing protein [Solirubrobacterales bacterium]
MAVILDSDAVIGFLDRRDALHDAADAAIRELVREAPLTVSAVTYAEVLTGVKLGHHPEKPAKGFFADLVSDVHSVDMVVADKAAELRAASKALRMPDALILATAETDPEVDLLVTGDAGLTKVSGFNCAVRLLQHPG